MGHPQRTLLRSTGRVGTPTLPGCALLDQVDSSTPRRKGQRAPSGRSCHSMTLPCREDTPPLSARLALRSTALGGTECPSHCPGGRSCQRGTPWAQSCRARGRRSRQGRAGTRLACAGGYRCLVGTAAGQTSLQAHTCLPGPRIGTGSRRHQCRSTQRSSCQWVQAKCCQSSRCLRHTAGSRRWTPDPDFGGKCPWGTAVDPSSPRGSRSLPGRCHHTSLRPRRLSSRLCPSQQAQTAPAAQLRYPARRRSQGRTGPAGRTCRLHHNSSQAGTSGSAPQRKGQCRCRNGLWGRERGTRCWRGSMIQAGTAQARQRPPHRIRLQGRPGSLPGWQHQLCPGTSPLRSALASGKWSRWGSSTPNRKGQKG